MRAAVILLIWALGLSCCWLGLAVAQDQAPADSFDSAMAAGTRDYKGGDYRKAESDFTTAFTIAGTKPQMAKAKFSAAVSAFKQGRIDTAKTFAQDALKLVPDYAKAQALLDEIAQLPPASEPAAPDAKSKKKLAASKDVSAEAVPSDASATKCAAVSQWARPGTTGEFHVRLPESGRLYRPAQASSRESTA